MLHKLYKACGDSHSSGKGTDGSISFKDFMRVMESSECCKRGDSSDRYDAFLDVGCSAGLPQQQYAFLCFRDACSNDLIPGPVDTFGIDFDQAKLEKGVVSQ